jgi:hypothetical protein
LQMMAGETSTTWSRFNKSIFGRKSPSKNIIRVKCKLMKKYFVVL